MRFFILLRQLGHFYLLKLTSKIILASMIGHNLGPHLSSAKRYLSLESSVIDESVYVDFIVLCQQESGAFSQNVNASPASSLIND